MTRIDEELLAQIERELGRDGVWVSPGLRKEVPPGLEAHLEAAVAEATTPTYVTLVELDSRDPLTSGDSEELAGVIRDDTGRTGIYVGMAPTYGDEPEFRLQLQSFPEDVGLYRAAAVAALEHPDDLGQQTLRVLDLLESGDAERLYEELDPDDVASLNGSTSGEEGLDAGAVTGLVAGALLVLAGVALAVRRLRRRPVAPPTPTSAGFTLPRAVLSTVRAAEDRRNEVRANTEVLALGEAIDEAELDPRHSQALPAWQAALDHYDVARRILDRRHSPADVVGAIVLAERGRAALDAAVRGRGWSPSSGCYFNPLHHGPAAPVRWRDGQTTVRVPACAACARALAADQEPPDVLDFVVEGRPAHYFRLDLGPWSSTGYGSLDPDLLGRLLDRRS